MTEFKIKKLIETVYNSRKLKLTDPEGYFDALGRWFPSPRENANDGMTVKSPTTKNRYSYRVHCRSKHHVRILVGLALSGHDVPTDVAQALADAAGDIRKPTITDRLSVPKREIPELVNEFMKWMETHKGASA